MGIDVEPSFIAMFKRFDGCLFANLVKSIFFLTTLSGLIGQFTLASVPIVVVENSQTGEQSALVINRSTPSELETMSPKNFNSSEKVQALLNRFKNYSKDVAIGSGKTILSIQGDFTLFTAATGAVAVRKLLTDSESNPNALKEFWYHQIENPFSWLSFYAFYAANKGTSALYEALVTKFGWMRNEKIFTEFMEQIAQKHFNKGYGALVAAGEIGSANLVYQRAMAVIPKPMLHNFFADLKGPLALGVGVFAINLSFDFLTDPNVQRCAGDWNAEKFIDFCDLAYQDWVIQGKILDQAPSFAGAVLTASIQSFLMNRGGALAGNLLKMDGTQKLVGKIKSFEFKGLEIALSKAKSAMQMRPVAFVAGAYIFLELFPIVTQPIDDFYKKEKFGSEIAAHQKKIDEMLNTTNIKKISTPIQPANPEYINALLSEIDDYSRANTKWREHWLLPVKKKFNSWLQYISNLQGDYLSSKQFYRELIRRLASPSPAANKLFQATPYYGLDAGYSIQEIGKKIVAAVQFSQAKLDSFKKKETRLSEDQIEAMVLLKAINISLMAISPSSELSPSLKAQIDGILQNSSLPEIKRARMITEARQQEFVKGIKRLQKMATNPRVGPHGLTEMNEILKGARPLDRGEFELMQMNTDAKYIVERDESKYPMKAGDIVVGSKAEELLTRFVCNEDSVISEIWGIGVYFHPPKMIRANITHNGGFNFCQLREQNKKSDGSEASVYNTQYQDVDKTTMTGLLEVAQKYLKTEFKGENALDEFDSFWSKTVDSPVLTKLTAKNAEFNEMLNSTLNPILNNNSLDSVQSAVVPRGTYPSLKKEYEYYLSILARLAGIYGLNIDLLTTQNVFALQSALLSKTLAPEKLKPILTEPEIAKLNTKLTVSLATLKTDNPKKLARTTTLALSEILDEREDAIFGTLLEKNTTALSTSNIIPSLIFVKMKLAGVKLQWKNLLMLEESLDVRGLKN